MDFVDLGVGAEAQCEQATDQGALEGSLQHGALLVIVAGRLINHVWLENNLTVMAIKAVVAILFILVTMVPAY
ncbi:hypothetical protein VAWG005_19020 [Aeromonas dhakensis]|nr:hypothetical protein VAWG005_19020 [Aeromonas dhakensis]